MSLKCLPSFRYLLIDPDMEQVPILMSLSTLTETTMIPSVFVSRLLPSSNPLSYLNVEAVES